MATMTRGPQMSRPRLARWLAFTLLVVSAAAGCVPDDDARTSDLFEPREYGDWRYDGQPDIDGPERVLMGDLLPGETRLQEIEIANVGRAPLRLDAWRVGGPFTVSFPIHDDAPPERLLPGEAVYATIEHTARDQRRAQGALFIDSDDPDEPVFTIDLLANTDAPCLEIAPDQVDFGQRELGARAEASFFASSCSTRSLVEFSLEPLVGDPAFSLDADDTYTLAPGETVELPIRFEPSAPGDYRAELQIISNDELAPTRTVTIEGRGRPYDCPSAQIAATNANRPGGAIADPTAQMQAVPLDTISLDARDSFDPEGTGIDRFEWSLVDRPLGSTNELEAIVDGNAELWMQTAGTYVVELRVWNQLGIESCEPARLQIDVIPDEDIHLQLVWRTPNDRNQTDSNGTDVDLHLLHPNADGRWNTSPWDCFWRNMEPDWGEAGDPRDNPSLDIDDTNGAGPENINLDNPQVGAVYQVGVYYYSDNNYGRSEVTSRIYIGGQLFMERSGRVMTNQQFWHVASVEWPSGRIDLVDRLYDSFP